MPITPVDLFKQEGIFFGEDTIANTPCSIGYIKKFRWRWMATQLNLFVMVGETDQPITAKLISDFSLACFRYATKNSKGWPRGFQSGVGSIAILKGTAVEPDAASFCRALSRNHWSGFEIPIICDTRKREYVRFQSNPLWGYVYFPFIAKTIDELLVKLP